MMIGRKREQNLLKKVVEAKQSHFVAVYGRRRVGKTFLIRSYFKNEFTFYATGLANANMAMQIQNFSHALQDAGATITEPPTNWLSAFRELKNLIISSNKKKKVIFLDELPWMDTIRSGFLSALEHFWNSWASSRKDILLIVCGSSASWMIHKLINNKGGLHNRITQKIKVNPFTLAETQEFLVAKKAKYTPYQIVKLYMTMGGIPYYLEQVEPSQSVDINIDTLFFDKNSLMYGEYELLFRSLFKNAEKHMAVVEAIAMANQGVQRDFIVKKTSLSNGGGLTTILNELTESNFIRQYEKTGNTRRETTYQLMDNFTLFYLKFLKPKKSKNKGNWLNLMNTPAFYSWAGNAFEIVCLQHIPQIKRAMGIAAVYTEESTWHNANAQIDLVMERKDDIINLFEFKFSTAEFTIDKKYAENLRNKISTFIDNYKSKSAVWLVMLTTYGVKDNAYNDMVQNSLTLDVLFNN